MTKIIKEFPILLPKNVDMTKWAVIACDQYTTDSRYWDRLSKEIGTAPSTLHVIFPEIYLKSKNIDERIQKIDETMSEYLKNDLFTEVNGYILTEREIDSQRKRIGLVACVDLEEYDFTGGNPKIRPTEETIEDRLPIRIHIREKAPLELPHILLLIDDENHTILKPLYENRENLEKLYDFELNMNGGRIAGYKVPYSDSLLEKFDSLLDRELQIEKYGKNAKLLFAVGDGNHSMATAKKCWENIKQTLTPEERKSHPARYALVEIINLYDEALDLLPIHRNIMNCVPDEFCEKLQKELQGSGTLTVITPTGERKLSCPECAEQTIIQVQKFLESHKKDGWIIEYVHEEEAVRSDAAKENCVGILMPSFPKNRLFDYTVNVGKLPKKAFSIGEEKTKKYYIEAKRIK